MKKERTSRVVYIQPSCSIIATGVEGFLCNASVTPDGSSSTQESWGSEQTHTGTVILGKQVNTVSGNNTEIIGSKVIGESVTTKVEASKI